MEYLSSNSELRIGLSNGEFANESSSMRLSSSVSASLRRIEFHPARKSFSVFENRSDDFQIETLNPDFGRKRPAQELNPGQSSKKPDVTDIVENGLDPEFNFGITFRRIGAGLENLGNTCFLNSVLQCLTYTEPLAAYLQSGKHQNSCHVAGFCALCAIQKHVSRALQSTGRSLVPKDLVSNLRCISRNFRNARQEDAHEYMVNLLESMHRCCLPSGVPTESPAAYEKSLVHRIFGGRLCSQVECQQCSFCSNKFDPFLDLSLEIVKADTLLVALRNFTAAELLDGGEKQYQCQKCKQKVRAKKRLTVHKAPYVLTIHLKRFHAHDPGRKVDKKVSFDRSLDMKPFVSGSYEGDLKYSLYGVLVHYGHNTHSGHYVCYVRTSSGMWYLLNDNQVRQVSEKTVLEQKAYMLFYVRDRKNIAPRKPVDIFQKEIVKNNVSNNSVNSVLKQFSKQLVDNGSNSGINAGIFPVAYNKEALIRSSNKILSKEELSLQNNSVMVAACPASRQEVAVGPTPSVGLLNKASKMDSSKNPQQGECLSPSIPSLNYNDNSKIENATETTGAKASDHRETPQKINSISDAGAPSEASPRDLFGKKAVNAPKAAVCQESNVPILNKTDSVIFPCKSINERSEGDCPPNDRAAGNAPSDQVHNSNQGSAHEPMESSTDLVVSNLCLHGKASDGTVCRKFKRKFKKCQISRIHVGLSFFRASLGLQKKKKHKRSKKYSLDTRNLLKEQLLDNNCVSSEAGPSTSKKSSTLNMSPSEDAQRKGHASDLKQVTVVQKVGDDSLTDITIGEVTARSSDNGAVLATNKQQNISISNFVPSQQGARKLDYAKNCSRDVSEEGSIPTRDVQERTVACWDGIELPSSVILESNVAQNFRIGYVPDEWDEEYDQGKRKKVRQFKHQFGGPNPFQEITTKKAQLKKAKINRFNSANQPFRI
ncbi:hypothetical protein K2173_021179 [Erythroxylum novogranatense]|uniref:Ubiquitin carboxyl-terminal hydrolase n=1 Tax=Erythroxylum novogranatense TaxID=1862640 RepID=A0AAV8TQR5_9ROSI|nr:hypothetical protein K2173_021179 [Erythroxylum novogranatense]